MLFFYFLRTSALLQTPLPLSAIVRIWSDPLHADVLYGRPLSFLLNISLSAVLSVYCHSSSNAVLACGWANDRVAWRPKGLGFDSTADFLTNSSGQATYTKVCPCSPSSKNWYQLAYGRRGVRHCEWMPHTLTRGASCYQTFIICSEEEKVH